MKFTTKHTTTLHPRALQVIVCNCWLTAAPVMAQQVVISEIMYHPDPAKSEWVELYNAGSSEVNLVGWRLGDSALPDGRTIARRRFLLRSGEYLVVAPDGARFADYPTPERILSMPRGFPSLNNEGDTVYLRDSTGVELDRVPYTNQWGGAINASLERMRLKRSGLDAANWSTCTAKEGGTPGRPNSARDRIGAGKVTWHIEPDPFSPDGDGADDVVTLAWILPVPAARLKLQIYDRTGRVIRTLLNNFLSTSEQSTRWDGCDGNGRQMPAGIYIVHMEAMEPSSDRSFSSKATLVISGTP